MRLDKEVFTTFDAAKICNANITSIKNWIDQGEMAAFRTPGGHYRIEREVLEGFLERHGMPNPFARRKSRRILAIHRDGALGGRLQRALGDAYETVVASGTYDGLIRIGQWSPGVVILDSRIEDLAIEAVCEAVRGHDTLSHTDVIVVGEEGPAGWDVADVVLEADDDDALVEVIAERAP